MRTTLGTFLINEILPADYKISTGQNLTGKKLKTLLVQIAREKPNLYPDIVLKLKQLGDKLATTEPYSPGLQDLLPAHNAKKFLDAVDERVKKEKDYNKKVDILSKAQEDATDIAMLTISNLTKHVISGGRGKPGQLMRMLVSPVAVRGAKRGVSPLTIKNSFSQGLNLGEYMASAYEARQNAIDTYIQVQKPGAVNKTFTSNLNSLIVTSKDCHTKNGIILDISDPHVLDRFTAEDSNLCRHNTLVDSDLLRKAQVKKIDFLKVRSSQTCESDEGLCAYCYGLLENKQLAEIGTNVGVRSAQALSEPLIQMALDSKHASKLTSAAGLRGLSAVDQLTKVPKNFLNKAVIAKKDGLVLSVKDAPQGGQYIKVDDEEYYIEPGFKVFVKPGAKVEAGDVLTEGIPSPREIVENKGLGAGRKYYIDALHQVYKNSGIDVDRRHIENLAKQSLNYVKINKSMPDQKLFSGDVVTLNKIKGLLRNTGKFVPLKNGYNKMLTADVLHFTVGTRVTYSMIDELKRAKIKEIRVADKTTSFTPLMYSVDMNPLQNPDLLSKLGFRYLKRSFIEGVAVGAKSNVHGPSPWPGYIVGKEFGEGESGKY